MKNRKPKKQEQEPIKRNTPRGEDPARLNDLNADKKPAPPQPADTKPEAEQAPMDGQMVVELGQRPKQKIGSDKPTNPPHPENDGTLWATEHESEAE